MSRLRQLVRAAASENEVKKMKWIFVICMFIVACEPERGPNCNADPSLIRAITDLTNTVDKLEKQVSELQGANAKLSRYKKVMDKDKQLNDLAICPKFDEFVRGCRKHYGRNIENLCECEY